MTLQSSGRISLRDIGTEYIDARPTSLSEFYGKPDVPSSGNLSISDFYGKTRIVNRYMAFAGEYVDGGKLGVDSWVHDSSANIPIKINGVNAILGAQIEDQINGGTNGILWYYDLLQLRAPTDEIDIWGYADNSLPLYTTIDVALTPGFARMTFTLLRQQVYDINGPIGLIYQWCPPGCVDMGAYNYRSPWGHPDNQDVPLGRGTMQFWWTE